MSLVVFFLLPPSRRPPQPPPTRTRTTMPPRFSPLTPVPDESRGDLGEPTEPGRYFAPEGFGLGQDHPLHQTGVQG